MMDSRKEATEWNKHTWLLTLQSLLGALEKGLILPPHLVKPIRCPTVTFNTMPAIRKRQPLWGPSLECRDKAPLATLLTRGSVHCHHSSISSLCGQSTYATLHQEWASPTSQVEDLWNSFLMGIWSQTGGPQPVNRVLGLPDLIRSWRNWAEVQAKLAPWGQLIGHFWEQLTGIARLFFFLSSLLTLVFWCPCCCLPSIFNKIIDNSQRFLKSQFGCSS
jgi:hypothetical protein